MVFRNRQKTIRVADVLHGCTPGRIQSVGYMQVIPLVSDLSDIASSRPSRVRPTCSRPATERLDSVTPVIA